MTAAPDLLAARATAAALLSERGFAREAAMAGSGDGDDFAEVRMALALVHILEARRADAAPRPAFARRMAGEEC